MKNKIVSLVMIAGLTLVIVAAACGGGEDETKTPVGSAATQAPAPEEKVSETPTERPITSAPSEDQPDEAVTVDASGDATGDPEEAAAADTASAVGRLAGLAWTVVDIDLGIKPAIALTADGKPIIAYMTEDAMGFVRAAVWTDEGFEIATVAEEYYYGPLDLAIGPDDAPHIAWHDHQAQQFEPDLGDAAYAVLRDGVWVSEPAEAPGHDGWDNRLTVDANGNPHMSGIDPRGFGGSGLEYYFRDESGEWTVEKVPTGSLEYTFATSIALDPSGNPHITYYNDADKNLMIASRDSSGWTVSTMDTDGDGGYFSELVIGEDGRFHVSYMEKTSESTGTVKYATRGADEEAWVVSTVGELTRLTFGFGGARHSTSIALDSEGRPWVSFGDQQNVYLAVPDGDGWAVVEAFDSGFQTLGQLVSLALDGDDNPHIAFFQATNLQPLQGRVKYLSGS